MPQGSFSMAARHALLLTKLSAGMHPHHLLSYPARQYQANSKTTKSIREKQHGAIRKEANKPWARRVECEHDHQTLLKGPMMHLEQMVMCRQLLKCSAAATRARDNENYAKDTRLGMAIMQVHTKILQ